MLGHTLLTVIAAVGAAKSTTGSGTSTDASGSGSSSSITVEQAPMVWFTKTIDGKETHFQSPYYQPFSTFWTQTATPASGKIGLGWISGSIGYTKSYPIAHPTQPPSSLITQAPSGAPTGVLAYTANWIGAASSTTAA